MSVVKAKFGEVCERCLHVFASVVTLVTVLIAVPNGTTFWTDIELPNWAIPSGLSLMMRIILTLVADFCFAWAFTLIMVHFFRSGRWAVTAAVWFTAEVLNAFQSVYVIRNVLFAGVELGEPTSPAHQLFVLSIVVSLLFFWLFILENARGYGNEGLDSVLGNWLWVGGLFLLTIVSYFGWYAHALNWYMPPAAG